MAFDLTPYRYTSGQLAGKLRKYTDLGGYPLFYLCADGETLCADCATEDGQTDDPHDPQWHIVGVDVNWEDENMYCAHCGEDIESAYGDAGEME